MTEPGTRAHTAASGGGTTDELAAEQRRVAALPFDKALDEFKAIVERLEAGNLPLEKSMALFESGVLLQRRCEELLSQAELRFQRLVESAGGPRTLDLSLGEANED